MTLNLENKIFYQPKLSFNNHRKWKHFCNSKDWDEVTTMFKERISDFFFEPIDRLYRKDSAGKILYIHNFPISNICWSLLDLLAQLEAGKRVKGIEVDNFLLRYSHYFTGIHNAVNLAKTYYSIRKKKRFLRKRKKIKNLLTVFAIFRNDPIHSAIVRRPGGLDHNQHEIFNIQNEPMIHNGRNVNYNIIVEDPIKLYEAIKKYLNYYMKQLKTDNNLKKKFQNRMESLYKFQFTNLRI